MAAPMPAMMSQGKTAPSMMLIAIRIAKPSRTKSKTASTVTLIILYPI